MTHSPGVLCLVSAIAVFLSPATVLPADPGLGKSWEAGMGAIVKIASTQELKRLLVVVREDARSSAEPQTPAVLGVLRKAMHKPLQAGGMSIVSSGQIAAEVAQQPAERLLTTEEVAQWGKVAEFDAVVCADYRKRGRRRSVRLALVTESDRLLVRTVVLSNDQVLAALPANAASGLSGFSGSTSGVGAGSSSSSRSGSSTGKSAGTGESAAGSAAGADAGDSTPPNEINKRILEFAISNLGKAVGSGICWELASEALKAAGAKPSQGNDWGDDLTLAQIQPGDIMEFQNVRFESGNAYQQLGAPGHTAIVKSVGNNSVVILHQNYGVRVVTTLELNFANQTQGEIRAYRAIPRNQ